MCGPCSLSFLMHQFGEKNLPADIAKELIIDREFGIGLFDLAHLPVDRGYNTKLFAWSAEHFPVSWRNSSPEKIKTLLEKEHLKPGSWKNSLFSFLQKGGCFYAAPISTEEIEKNLRNGFGVILYLDSAVLYKHADGVWGHYGVLKRCGQQRWNIVDPHWKYGGHKSYPKDLILFSFYSAGGYCLFMKK